MKEKTHCKSNFTTLVQDCFAVLLTLKCFLFFLRWSLIDYSKRSFWLRVLIFVRLWQGTSFTRLLWCRRQGKIPFFPRFNPSHKLCLLFFTLHVVRREKVTKTVTVSFSWPLNRYKKIFAGKGFLWYVTLCSIGTKKSLLAWEIDWYHRETWNQKQKYALNFSNAWLWYLLGKNYG